MVDLRKIATEQRNPRTTHIDELSTLEMVKLINSEDHKVAEAVEAVCPQIAKAVDAIAERLRQGGRLIYVGCGTSGRLGIIPAPVSTGKCFIFPARLPPTPSSGTQPFSVFPLKICKWRFRLCRAKHKLPTAPDGARI